MTLSGSMGGSVSSRTRACIRACPALIYLWISSTNPALYWTRGQIVPPPCAGGWQDIPDLIWAAQWYHPLPEKTPHGINQPWFSACSLARNHARDSCKEKILLLFDIFLRKEGGKKMFPCCRLVAPSCIKGRAGTRNITNPYVCPQGDIAVSWEPPRNGALWHSPTCHLSWLCVSAFRNALPKL